MSANPMSDFYTKLKGKGFSRDFVADLLPPWWDDRIASTEAGRQQVALRLARLFSLRPSSLLLDEQSPEFALGERRFKRAINVDAGELDRACALAAASARLVWRGFERPAPESIPAAHDLRSQLLSNHRWIDFPILLERCWEMGIPVLFLSHLPHGAKKMAGVAMTVDGRPAIILTNKHPHGYLLFHLAHELGHVALGHVANGAWVVDEKIDESNEDDMEAAANAYALELLTGSPDCRIGPRGKHIRYPKNLAIAAMDFAASARVDPLHVVLNYGYSQNNFQLAGAAIKLIADGRQSDQAVCRGAIKRYVDFESLGEADGTALAKLVGVSLD